MLKRYIVILVISVLMVIFALQNVDKVNIKLWFFEFNASLSLLIIITFSVGAILSLVFTYQELRSRNKASNNFHDQEEVSGDSDSIQVTSDKSTGNVVR